MSPAEPSVASPVEKLIVPDVPPEAFPEIMESAPETPDTIALPDTISTKPEEPSWDSPVESEIAPPAPITESPDFNSILPPESASAWPYAEPACTVINPPLPPSTVSGLVPSPARTYTRPPRAA